MQLPVPLRMPVPVRVLFVCLGNICRSPTAEGVMRALVREAGLQATVELDSAGTGGWHVGSAPDQRAAAAAGARGIELGGRARTVTSADLERFDLLLAKDRSNADGREAFVKTRAGAGSGEYEAEAAGLRWLAEPGSLRTPAVFEVGTSYLALEWVRRGTLSEAGAEELGRGLARTHLAGAGSFGA